MARRSREGAWIEMPVTALHLTLASVAPARERGLKFWQVMELIFQNPSLPEGSVD